MGGGTPTLFFPTSIFLGQFSRTESRGTHRTITNLSNKQAKKKKIVFSDPRGGGGGGGGLGG